MADLNVSINAYVRDVIALPKDDISEAAKSREWLLQRIAKEISARRNEPVLFADRPFVYYGSYFKQTKVAAVDEYDVLVVIDSRSGVFKRGDVEIGTGEGAADPNHKYDEKFKKTDGSGVSPAKLLNWLKGIVEDVVESFDGEAPEREGQAVTARIVSKGLKIDLVPAGIFRHTTSGEIFYDIPRGDKDNGWVLTAPEKDIERLKEAANGRENFRNVIRIAKRIKDTYRFQVSSFAVETAIIDYTASHTWEDDLFSDLSGVLTYLASAFRGKIVSDPFDEKANLLEGAEQLDWYAERLDAIVVELNNCVKETDQDRVSEKVKRLFENE